MKSIVPYTKEIKFNSKLAEICSISLEHELQVNDNEIEGNFIISGEYKSHEISVNKENFLYKLPFSIDVTDNLIKDSIDFEITDFTYEIVDDDILKVNIEFSVTAMEEENEEGIDREAMIEEINDLFLDSDNNEEVVEDRVSEIESVKEIEEIEEKEEVIENEKIDNAKAEEVRLDKESSELILDSASKKEDEYTTYFIHIVKQEDTIESIISTYQTDLPTLKRYNVIDNINIGDKIIIPSLDE